MNALEGTPKERRLQPADIVLVQPHDDHTMVYFIEGWYCSCGDKITYWNSGC